LHASRENIKLELSVAIPVQKESIGAKKKEKTYTWNHEDSNLGPLVRLPGTRDVLALKQSWLFHRVS